jgi:hypothetical protein
MGRMPERCLHCGSDKGPPLILRYLIFSRDITLFLFPPEHLTAEGHL